MEFTTVLPPGKAEKAASGELIEVTRAKLSSLISSPVICLHLGRKMSFLFTFPSWEIPSLLGNVRSKETFPPKKVFLPKNVLFHSHAQDREVPLGDPGPKWPLGKAYCILVSRLG